MAQPVEAGYSAAVALKLYVGGQVLRLAQVGPERIVLKQPEPVPAGEAELEVTIDGSTTRQSIVIETSGAATTGEIWYR
jgi:hypothetical protein